MSTSIAMPHLTLCDRVVTAEPWIATYNDARLACPDRLDGWDYSKRIQLQRRVDVDLEQAARRLGLAESDIGIAVAVNVASGSGSIARLVRNTRVVQLDKGGKAIIEIVLDSGELAARIALETCLLTSRAPRFPGPMSPTRAASRLWSDYKDIAIEPAELRFPMEVLSFSKRFPGNSKAQALWYLHWLDYDPLRNLRGALRLYLNSDDKDFLDRIKMLDHLTLRLIMADVIGQICERVLREPDLDSTICEALDGSICSQALSWLHLAFEGKDPRALLRMLEERPGDFRSAMQAIAEMET